MTYVSAGHIILTPTQPVGSRLPQSEWNPGPPHQESRALSTELPRPPLIHGVHSFVFFIRFNTIEDYPLRENVTP